MEGDVESGFISASGEATVMGEGVGRDVAEIGSELTVFLGKKHVEGHQVFLGGGNLRVFVSVDTNVDCLSG